MKQHTVITNVEKSASRGEVPQCVASSTGYFLKHKSTPWIRTILCIVLLLPIAAVGQKQSEFDISIADKTEETGLLEKNQWQTEGGFLHNSYHKGAPSEMGQFFLRHGISNRIELRLLIEDGNERDRYLSETVQATYPLAVGAKVKVLEHHSVLPDMTLVTYLQIPFTAHNKMQSGYWSPMVFMAFQHKLSDKWSVNYNAGGQQEPVGTAWAGIFNGSVHYKFTDQFEVFSEYFAQYEPSELPQHNIGAGGTFQINDHFCIYLSGGSSVATSEWNRFVAAGLAAKW